MAQDHGDRLSATDASFLHQEGQATHMHVGAVTIFEGPPPAYEDFVAHIRSRLHLVPRYRQKLAVPPFETGRPLWVDDPDFNIEYHIRHTALPSPGTEAQLRALAARVHSQQLDRNKPLWELWLVQGLDDGRFAFLTKAHHALVDGISGVDLATVILDLTPIPQAVAHPGEPWTPRPEPTAAQMLARGLKGAVKAQVHLATRAANAARNPQGTLEATREAAEGLGEIVWAALNPAPETPLNVEIGPHRRLVFVRTDLADFKLVKNTFGGTVNDVVLAVAAGALRTWLRARGVRTEGIELRALVPVSIRTEDQRHQLGNRIVAMRGPLPVYVEDPVARLRVVKQAMDGLKESKQALGAEVLTRLERFAPPTVLAQAVRINFSTRLFNLIVTNVPGPQFPLYLLGRELQDLFPIAFLPKDHALAIAIMSYNGGIAFGLLGDYDALPDIELIGDAIESTLGELVDAAHEQRRAEERPARKPKRAASSRARTSRPRTSGPASTAG